MTHHDPGLADHTGRNIYGRQIMPPGTDNPQAPKRMVDRDLELYKAEVESMTDEIRRCYIEDEPYWTVRRRLAQTIVDAMEAYIAFLDVETKLCYEDRIGLEDFADLIRSRRKPE